MSSLGTASVIRANSRHLPLDDNSVDLVVTSPPYFALRSYQDGGEHYAGQIGDEPTPAEFVDSLLEVTAECARVLKPSGSLWVNLGDKYSRGSRPLAQPDQFRDGDDITYDDPKYVKNMAPENSGVAGKSLIGIPWRYALRCIDDLGLILRAEVIWSKPNGLPESVTDRVRRSHEQWFHFTLEPRYFANLDAIRVKYDGERALSRRIKRPGVGKHAQRAPWLTEDERGSLPPSVRTVATEPLSVPKELGVDHFAAFPTEWPRWIIEGWSPPPGECTQCGWVAVDDADWCSDCGELITPAVVLDPFGGTGTTAMVAKALGRHGISVDMSADYCRLAEWRTNDRDQLAKVLGIGKADGPTQEESLFDLLDGETGKVAAS